MIRKLAIPSVVLVVTFLPSPASAEELTPFVIPAEGLETSPIALPPGPAIATNGPRVVARDGQFYLGEKRIRVWGVNTCFGASFPTHADAGNVAARLAAAGINSVRMHHMDSSAFPRGIWDPEDATKLSAEALDRLDYFIDQLAKHGITTNINLHVSRTHSRVLGLPQYRDMPKYDKVIGIFTPKLIAAQKKYARDLLGRVNEYRKVRYAADPAVAFVEITNEDSFFMWDGEHRLQTLAPYYEGILRGMFAAWLKQRYGDTGGLRKAWSQNADPLGGNLIGDPAFTLKAPADSKKPRWSLEQHEGASASVRPAKGAPGGVRIELQKLSGSDWHVQFRNAPLAVRKGQYYTLSFRARADRPRTISVGVGMNHAPWGDLGLRRSVSLGDNWQAYRMGFVARAKDAQARLSFTLGGDAAAVELAEVMLASGGQVGLAEGESIEAGSVKLFADSEVDTRALDRVRFLAQTEKDYFDGMRKLVRDEIGCKALVTGTIVFGPAGLYGQSDMDFIDAHAYWHHPRFPGQPWDSDNWLIEQSAMTGQPEKATLPTLSCQRLAGKPYTVSEYNHPAPMDAQAECVPMIAAWAARQGWNGVWLFTYSQRADDWAPRRFTGYFDMDANPAKFGFFVPGAVLFRDGSLTEVLDEKVYDLSTNEDLLTTIARLHTRHGRSMQNVLTRQFKVTWQQMLTNSIAVSLGAGPSREVVELPEISIGTLQTTVSVPDGGTLLLGPSCSGGEAEVSAAEPIEWIASDLRRRFVYCGERAVVQTGWWAGPLNGKPTFRAVAAAALDGRPLKTSRKILIAACGRCENTGMKFTPDRRSVRSNWGAAPVRIEPVDHELVLPGTPGDELRLTPLGPDGRPAGKAEVIELNKETTVLLFAKHKTMWYLLTRP